MIINSVFNEGKNKQLIFTLILLLMF